MVAAVPAGAFLLVGIDSTTIVALMQAMSPGKVKTFSIGFGVPEYNEAQYAKEIASYFGTDHTELYVSEKNALDVIPKMSSIYTEPFADSSQIPTYLVSKLAREQVTVSLSGDGRDELFCGYNSYVSVDRIWNKIRRIPLPLRKMMAICEKFGIDIKSEKLQTVGHYIAIKGSEEVYEKRGNKVPQTDFWVKDVHIPDFKYNQYPSEYLGEKTENNRSSWIS